MHELLRCSKDNGRYMGGLIGGIVALATLYAVVARSASRQRDALTISPRVADLTQRSAWDGDTLTARFTLLNSSAQDINLDALRTSCTCAEARSADGADPPLRLRPGQTLDVAVRVNATAAFDDQRVRVVATGKQGGKDVQASGFVTFRARNRVTADPPVLMFGELGFDAPTVTRRVVIRAAPDSTVGRVVSVESSNPGVASVVLVERDADKRDLPTQEGCACELDITVRPSIVDGNKLSEHVALRFEGGMALSIPVYGWVGPSPR